MSLTASEEWAHTLRRDDDLLVGSLRVPFLSEEVEIEVCFVVGDGELTVGQWATFSGYLEQIDRIHQLVLERVFEEYRKAIMEYREAFRKWGEDPDENAPVIFGANQLHSLLKYQTLFIPSEGDVGTFGMGFWAKWEREHGVGVRFSSWELEDVGENAVHFQF